MESDPIRGFDSGVVEILKLMIENHHIEVVEKNRSRLPPSVSDLETILNSLLYPRDDSLVVWDFNAQLECIQLLAKKRLELSKKLVIAELLRDPISEKAFTLALACFECNPRMGLFMLKSREFEKLILRILRRLVRTVVGELPVEIFTCLWEKYLGYNKRGRLYLDEYQKQALEGKIIVDDHASDDDDYHEMFDVAVDYRELIDCGE